MTYAINNHFLVKRSIILLLFVLAIIAILSGCQSKKNKNTLILATTTSLNDTGILDVLISDFNKSYPKLKIKPVAVGTGEALAMGKKGNADILIVHSPEDEKKFIKDGFGVERIPLMYNYFVIVGPKTDPAKIRGKSTLLSFKSILNNNALFISRGDDSGTHKKELKIWDKAGTQPASIKNYLETGQGMAETLRIADQKQGYTLSDRGTYLYLKKTIDLADFTSSDSLLFNEYFVIKIDPKKFPKVNTDGASALIRYLKSKKAHEIIKKYGKDKVGEPLFFSSKW